MLFECYSFLNNARSRVSTVFEAYLKECYLVIQWAGMGKLFLQSAGAICPRAPDIKSNNKITIYI